MNFKLKAHVQKNISFLPFSERINFFFQKNITKSLPISDEEFVAKIKTVKQHFQNYITYSNEKIKFQNYFEFGSGYDLIIPFGIRLMGFENLTCIDIRELVFPELINNTIERFKKLNIKLSSGINIPQNLPKINRTNYKSILKEDFNINYIAPLDARATGLPPGSIDFILSNATMEHIPEKHIKDIMIECFNLLKPGGIMSNAIDYRDHWSFFDKTISKYNYLQFSDKSWKKLNPSIMYQNRMRHKDYIRIISEAGFEIIDEKRDTPTIEEYDQLRKLKLDTYYNKNYSIEELSILSSMLVLRKPN